MKFDDEESFRSYNDPRVEISTSTPFLILNGFLFFCVAVACFSYMGRDLLLVVAGDEVVAELQQTRSYACGKLGQNTCTQAMYSFTAKGVSFQTGWHEFMFSASKTAKVNYFSPYPEINKIADSIRYANPPVHSDKKKL